MEQKHLIGFIRPATPEAATARVDRRRLLPANVSYTEVELGIRDINENDISLALSRLEEAAAELTRRNVDAISMGGNPIVVSGGYGFDKKIIERIGRVAVVPATTSQTSAITGLKLMGAKKIILVEPWKDYVHQLLIKFLEASGFQIVGSKMANLDLKEFPRIPPSLSYELAVAGWKEAPDADAIYIPCPIWPVLENIDAIENETGMPVVSDTQTGAWGALRLLGLKSPVAYGRLLREH